MRRVKEGEEGVSESMELRVGGERQPLHARIKSPKAGGEATK